MAFREWPLVLFTLLGQMAVGSFLLLLPPVFLSAGPGPPEAGRDLRLTVALAAAGVLSTAMLAAFFHLGNPLNALNALNNLRSSWLSREVLFLGTTIALLLALALFRMVRIRSAGLSKGLAVAAGLSGILFLFSMARLYMLPTVKAWNTISTPASFFLTALLLGAATVATSSAWVAMRWPSGYVRTILLAAVILTAASLAITALASPHFGPWGPVLAPGLKPPASPALALFIGRSTLLFAGAVLLVLQLRKVADPSWTSARGPLLAALAFLLAAEILGRFLFYSAYLK